MKEHSFSVGVDGREITFETGKIARLANGAVIVTCGETKVFVTACASSSAPPEADFFPLRVDYQEKFSSAGKTLGGFIKREGRPAEREILTCRLIDRPLRPMFEDGYFNEVQVIAYVISYDGEHSPEPLAICGASAALSISDIPLIKPIASVRVGKVKDRLVINPTRSEQGDSSLELLLAGTEDAILMIEGSCEFFTEEELLEAIEEGHKAIKEICIRQAEWQNEIGKPKNRDSIRTLSQELIDEVDKLIADPIHKAFRIESKQEREQALGAASETALEALVKEEEEGYSRVDVMRAIKKVSANHMRKMILKENLRSDGRTPEQIRAITVEQGLLPRTHGSALFTRGETQSLAVCTLGGENAAQRYEDLDQDSTRRFYLQYSFPPFSVGEVGRMGPPGRREVGHGKLAENALRPILPNLEKFPYTIRLESNITESNGSSSMASVCGGAIAMMNAGVPIKTPVAGIAMGLILDGNDFVILSDILGSEDALGDMDFKVAGNEHGITAFQLDIKVEGINHNIMQAALAQAKQGRLHILKKMTDAVPEVNKHLSKYAPHIEAIQIKPSKIGVVIGPGGKQIRAITEETGVEVDIDDSGIINIVATDRDSLEQAKQIIHDLTAEVEVGKVYKGKIVSIVPFGIFVRIFSQEGLCHISEISTARIKDINEVVKEGDTIEVKVLEINDRGQIKLSRKAVLTTAST